MHFPSTQAAADAFVRRRVYTRAHMNKKFVDDTRRVVVYVQGHACRRRLFHVRAHSVINNIHVAN